MRALTVEDFGEASIENGLDSNTPGTIRSFAYYGGERGRVAHWILLAEPVALILLHDCGSAPPDTFGKRWPDRLTNSVVATLPSPRSTRCANPSD
jgi:hypothetical protein